MQPVQQGIVRRDIQRKLRGEEYFTWNRGRSGLNIPGMPVWTWLPRSNDSYVLQFEIITDARVAEDVAELDPSGIDEVAYSTADVPVNCGWGRQPERRLPPDQEVRIAERRRQALGLDAQRAHGSGHPVRGIAGEVLCELLKDLARMPNSKAMREPG